jgi:molecular chaperone DnaK
MSEVVGIDLGTTNTVVGAFRNGAAQALPDEEGRTLIPSVVSFHPNGSVLVGKAARERRTIDPKSTIYSVKRLIGRSWDTEEVQRARSRLPFDMREGPGQAALIAVRGETYTLPEISAFVLRRARTVAEQALGADVERAVITVPANFNDLQRAATKVAARVAGLEVLRILNEPTAAALAYGYGKGTTERVAVYDFGGGTFDVTLLDLSNNVFEVLATAGNTFLGGDDIDLAIAERMADQALRQFRYDARADPILFDRLRLAAERIKHDLSEAETATTIVRELTHGAGGKPLDLTFTLSRSELELIAGPIIDQTFEVCRDALGVARLTVGDLDQVMLVGGSTRIPLVKQRVEEFFRRPGQSHLSPDEVVAMGAAIQASALAGAERRKSAIPPPPAAARRASTQPGVGRGTLPTGGPRSPADVGRLRLSSMTDASADSSPETKPFEPRRQAPTRPGLQPAARAAGVTSEGTKADTLLGLGTRGRAKTGSGLGPDAELAKSEPSRPAAREEPPVAPSSDFEEESSPVASSPSFIGTSSPVASAPSSPFTTSASSPVASFEPEPASVLDEVTHRYREEADEAPVTTRTTSPLENLPPETVESLGPDEVEFDESRLPLPEVPDEVTARVFTVPIAPGPISQGPPSSGRHRGLPPAERVLSVPAPVLIDVTPLTLSVETVGGYCDPLIGRNTPVPCDRTRTFVTAVDNQTTVRVRVGQGESSRFGENTLLGELELSALRSAARGAVEIAVTFTLDTNGMLNVSARDLGTGRATEAQLYLVGLPEARELEGLAARHAAQRAG